MRARATPQRGRHGLHGDSPSPVVVEIAGTCSLDEGERWVIDRDDVTLRGITRGAGIVGNASGFGTNITVFGGARTTFENLRIECLTGETCVTVTQDGELEIYDSTITAVDGMVAARCWMSRLYFLDVRIEAEYAGVRALGRFAAFSSSIHADVPMVLVDGTYQLNRLTVVSSSGYGLFLENSELLLTNSQIVGDAILDGSTARISMTELDALTARRSVVDMGRDAAIEQVSLEQFSSSVVDLDPGEIGTLSCDETSNAQCLEPEGVTASNCAACPQAQALPGAPGLSSRLDWETLRQRFRVQPPQP